MSVRSFFFHSAVYIGLLLRLTMYITQQITTRVSCWFRSDFSMWYRSKRSTRSQYFSMSTKHTLVSCSTVKGSFRDSTQPLNSFMKSLKLLPSPYLPPSVVPRMAKALTRCPLQNSSRVVTCL